ncbi:MAG TPA: ABC transporter ATP-binding protein [Candidatus Limnocylindria bacterium]|jgi:ATP-binding cassette subfamily B protein|nr:ABC transporter ATP-binding protein [Candidatus Limnocylindria bacterium]
MRAPNPYVDLFRRYVAPQWRSSALLAVLLLASIALELVGPQLLRAFIDSAIGGAALESLATLALAFVGVALVTQLLIAGSQYVGESLGWSATNALRADLALHCLQLDLSFHKARTAGELIERIDGDVTALATFFSRFAVNVLGNLLLLVGVLIVVAREDLRAGLALTIFAVVAVFLMAGPLRNITVKYWGRVREVSAQMYGFLGERLAGTEDIRSSGAEADVMAGLAWHHRAWLKSRREAIYAASVLWSMTILIFALGNAVAFGVGAYLWSLGVITIGTVYLIFHYTDMLRRPIEQLRRELEQMQRAVASVGRITELLDTQTRLPEGRGAPIPMGPLAVELDRVSFAYEAGADGDDLVLRDISVRLAPGEVLGVLGRTGSGKTTLARLLLRFYDPTSGTIRLGGVDLREARLGDVRTRATLVSQDVQLFHARVRENITFFDPSIDDERITAVLDRIGLGAWLRALPRDGDGALDTQMLAGGLSAGEAQLLAFARVFLRDPGLVILDEASSRLDSATERHIERAIDALLADRTGIVIAHRLATLQRCDRILILEEGRIVEQGPRAALAQDQSSRFSELLRTGLEQVLA